MKENKQELKKENGVLGLLSTSKAAEFLGFAVITLKTWRQQGKGPKYIKIHNKCYYDKEDLKQFIKGE